MTAPTEIKDWVTELSAGSVFTLDHVQKACPTKTRNAIKTGLSRLTQGEDPLIARATRGIYVRRNVGSAIPFGIHHRVKHWLNWQIAGPGSGLAPPNAVNAFGWSTQLPAKENIVVVGRPPKSIDKTVRYFQRSNTQRRLLAKNEVSLLEAISEFDKYSEKTWEEAVDWAKKRRTWVTPPSTMDTKLFRKVADCEAHRGKKFLDRCYEIAEVYV